MLKTGILLGSFFSLMTIVLGAFGAHALKEQLSEYGQSIYDKAVLYQMFHTIAILLLGVIEKFIPEVQIQIVGVAFLLGILIFSGSLYILAITGMKWLGMITPIGGLLFIIGWVLLFLKVL